MSLGLRRFSTSLPRFAAAVKIPLQLHGVDGRYATALFSAAAKKNVLDNVEQDLNKIQSYFTQNPKVTQFLETPVVDRSAKMDAIKKLLQSGKYADVTANLFTVLAENGRLDHTSKIIAAFEQLLSAHRGEVTVTVTSAKELDAKSLKQLTASIQKSSLIEKNAKVSIVTKVDPEILGGLVVEVGDKTVDMSVSSRINKLNRLLTESI